jgi:hypothetical protein
MSRDAHFCFVASILLGSFGAGMAWGFAEGLVFGAFVISVAALATAVAERKK